MNHCILIGRLTNSPDLIYTQSGVAICKFTLAVDRRKGANGEKETDFIPCVVFQKQAENCANYLSKGSQCAIDGRIQVRSYTDKDGGKRWMTEVIANSVQFLDSRSQKGGGNPLPDVGNEVDYSDEDIPF